MNKKHLLWWIFDFLHREHPDVLTDMQSRLSGDATDAWVNAALAERLAAFQEAGPAGYKFLGEYAKSDGPTTFRDLVVADPDRRLAEKEAAQYLAGATKVDMITLSNDDLKHLKLQAGQIRTSDGIIAIDRTK